MSEYAVLDLFCGLGGFSQAFEESDRWGVTTVDIEERFDPDICSDVFDLRPSDFEQEFDVVLASPPCQCFSVANFSAGHFSDGRPQTDRGSDALALVHHTIGLIRGLSPRFWFVENPRGLLRSLYELPTGTVCYCQYGLDWMKPTDLWGRHPPHLEYKQCSNGDNCHQSAPRGFDSGTQSSHVRDPAERAKVPDELSRSIRDACEAALDGEAPEQQTLSEVEP